MNRIRGGLVTVLFSAALLYRGMSHAATQDQREYFPHSLTTTMKICSSGTVPVLSEFEVSWYSKFLNAAGEPSLYRESLDRTKHATKTYRFTWLRSFHAPIIIRVDETASGEMHLIAKRLSRRGGYEPGYIDAVVRRSLSSSERDKLRRLLVADNVVGLASTDCTIGSDGAEWILEARTGEAYNFVSQFMPQDGPIREVGLFLLGLTGWKITNVY